MPSQAYQYQWQNPELRKSIYPFREQKLRDFLLAYEEVDLWQAIGSRPVDPRDEFELTHEYARLKTELEAATQANRLVQEKIREILRSKPLRDLAQVQINLRSRLREQGGKKASLERRVAWYVQFAPEHPYCQKWRAELNTVDSAYGEVLARLQAAVLASLAQAAAAMLSAAAAAQPGGSAGGEIPATRVNRLTEALREIPPLDKTGRVTQAAAVRWRMLKRRRELEGWDHDRLLAAVIERFDAEPQRYPQWLQYMAIHFSGMRYKSSHGSWASPRDLLEILEIEDQRAWVEKKATPAELEKACTAVIARLQQERSVAPRPVDVARIDARLVALRNPATRQEELLKALVPQAVERVRSLTDEQAEAGLKARKDKFPPWAWKEIVSRTGLRVTEVADSNWETLTPAEQLERVSAEDQHWREIMNAWERQDITSWRAQHGATLELIVTRAVCNEVAEHILHLRGVKPAAGLSAKPEWYMKLERAHLARPERLLRGDRPPYFRPPGSQKPQDFYPGASILWLGWVTQQPNAWQIARPLPGLELVPAQRREVEVRRGAARRSQKETWNYRSEGTNFVRVAGSNSLPKSEKRPPGLPATGMVSSQGQGKEWLRWTHEAIIVDVVQMAGNVPTVLTFEPVGRIGLNRRTLSSLQNSWEIYVGYVPNFYKLVKGDDQIDERAQAILNRLGEMLDRSKILPAAVEAPASFGLVYEEEAESPSLAGWKSLTPREQQVIALANRELPVREIAVRLETSRSTVKRALASAIRKLGVSNRAELRRYLAGFE